MDPSKGPRISLLTVLTIVGSFTGLALGVAYKTFIGGYHETAREMKYFSFVGDVYFEIIKCLVVPVFIASLVCGIGNLRLANITSVAVRGLVYAMTSLILAILGAVATMLIVEPGIAADLNLDIEEINFDSHLVETTCGLIRQMFPENLLHLDEVTTTTVVQYQNYTPGIRNFHNYIYKLISILKFYNSSDN